MPSRQPVQIMKTPERTPLRSPLKAKNALESPFTGILKLLLNTNATVTRGIAEKQREINSKNVNRLNNQHVSLDTLFHCTSTRNWFPRYREFKFAYKKWKEAGYSCKPLYYGKMEDFLEKNGKELIRSNLARKMGGGYIVCVDNNEKKITNMWNYNGECTIYLNTRLLVRHMHRFINKLLHKKEYALVEKRYNLSGWKKDIWGQYREISN